MKLIKRLFRSLLISSLIISCDAIHITKDLNIAEMEEQSSPHIEKFLFFTDPHLSEYSFDVYRILMKNVVETYLETEADYCLCGGDWLTCDDSVEDACITLDFIHDLTDSLFTGNFYMALGNHDTNYQGKKDDESARYTGQLDDEILVELMYKKYGRLYYSFHHCDTDWFVFDSGIDWETEMTAYRWEQVEWFADELQNVISPHVAVLIHIYANYNVEGEMIIQPLAENLMNVSMAYNRRESIEIREKTYDFSNASGAVAFFLCGHNHEDYVVNTAGIPVICTVDFKKRSICTYDVCTVNWNIGKMYMDRVGYGDDREVDIVIADDHIQ